MLLSNWTDGEAHQLFADNVALDDSVSGRENVAAVTPTRGRATMRHADGTELQLDLELSPQVPPRLQLYEEVEG